MTRATKALMSYGFEDQGDGSFVLSKAGREKVKFVPQDGGFHNFRREDGAWRQYPFSIHADWKGVGGLCFDEKQAAESNSPPERVKPQCYEWVFPEAWVVTEYETGAVNKAQREADRLARRAADAGG